MKKSFFAYILFLGLLSILLLLRLLSLSFPREGSGRSDVIHLDAFHDLGNILEIYPDGKDYFLKPFSGSIRINEEPVKTTVMVKNNDVISVEDKKFVFRRIPGESHYRKVFQRPLNEILPSENLEIYLGGWLSDRNNRLLSKEKDRRLLKKLAVEIAPEILRKLVPPGTVFQGKLLVISRCNLMVPEAVISPEEKKEPIQVVSPQLKIVRQRSFHRTPVAAGTPVGVRSGDIIHFVGNSGNGTCLSVKFDFQRVKAKVFVGERGNEKLVPRDITYVIISYQDRDQGGENRKPYLVYLKSFVSGQYYYLDNSKSNLFLGSKGLFRFSISPGQLIGRRYIPESVYEGGIMDMKELLDRDLVYRRLGQFHPVDIGFIQNFKNLCQKGSSAVQTYLKRNHIEWRHFSGLPDMRRFAGQSEKILTKMDRKGVWSRFCRAVEDVNNRFIMKGVGIGGKNIPSCQVYYRIDGVSWLKARPWENDIPLLDGIEKFYWGDLINGNHNIQFRFDFSRAPRTIRLISVGGYAYGFDGERYVKRDFLDGIQDIDFKPGNRRLYVRIHDYDRFNREISQAGLQVKVNLKGSGSEFGEVQSDETWQSSIDLLNWVPAKINRLSLTRQQGLEKIKSIWYAESWDPFFRGYKNRYFRKTFRLGFVPKRVFWKIHTTGAYILWVNNRMVGDEYEFLRAMAKGKNTLMVMVSKKGYQKNKTGEPLFSIRNNRLVLTSGLSRQTGWVRGRKNPGPVILDRKRRVLGFNCVINGRQNRFYSAAASGELNSITGSNPLHSWGLEQIFGQPPAGMNIDEIQLTIDLDWQKIAVDNISKILEENKKREMANPRYQQLAARLSQAFMDLTRVRAELAESSQENIQRSMENVIEIQERIDHLGSELNKIKNYFYEASVIILDSRGRILVAAVFPFDETGMKTLNDEIKTPYRAYETPGLNRAWKWKYNPGSTAKILDSISFLYSASLGKGPANQHLFPFMRKLLNPLEGFGAFPRKDLKGSRMLNGKQLLFHLQNFRGHDIPAGFCTLEQALIHSYNTYFGYVSLHNHRMLTDDSALFKNDRYFIAKSNIPMSLAYREFPLLEFAERLGLNRQIDLLENLNETPVSDALRRRPYDAFFAVPSVFPVNAYSPSDIAYMSVGQSDFQLTTLQNAMIASTILNRGYLFAPSIVESLKIREKSRRKIVLKPDPDKNKRRIFIANIADTIRDALKKVVDQGTAAGVFNPELRRGRIFYAKTGTAETKFYPDNSLFIGFVEFRNAEKIVFSITVPRSGTGAAVAGRLLARIINDIILLENKNKRGL
jgi:cell division protein FtsI/penicillin-binding protein 2